MAKDAENWVEFGLWVKRKREAKGWTQEEMAKRVGFSDRQTIYRIEAGASTKRASVFKIAEALGESLNEALAIAFGLQRSTESADDLADRQAQAARTAKLIENWTMMSPEEQARTLAIIDVLRTKNIQKSRIVMGDEWEKEEGPTPDIFGGGDHSPEGD